HAIPTMTAVRTKRMKLVRYPTAGDLDELYDLANDPAEMTNVVNDPAYAAERARLERLLVQSQEEVGWSPRVFPRNLQRVRGETGVLVDLQAQRGRLVDGAGSGVLGTVETAADGSWTLDGGRSPMSLAFDRRRDPSSWPYEVEVQFRVGGDGVLLSTSGPDSGFSVFVEDGRPAVSTRVKTWITTTTTIDGPRLAEGAWANVRARVDFNELSLAVNDTLVERVALPLPLKRPTNSPLLVGAPSAPRATRDTPTQPFRGSIQRFRISRPDVQRAESSVASRPKN
ncbi:MAG: LamG domain-containing protein, partial [Planctomycetota bacterium]